MSAASGHTSSSGGLWKYRLGLLLILAVVLIWVGSAEVTQLIFEKYRHPFLLTWLGASLLAFYLPVAYLREFLVFRLSGKQATHPPAAGASRSREKEKDVGREREGDSSSVVFVADSLGQGISGNSATVTRSKSPKVGSTADSTAKEVELVNKGKSSSASFVGSTRGKQRVHSPRDEEEEEESVALLSSVNGEQHGHGHGHGHGESSKHVVLETQQLTMREVLGVSLLLAPLWLLTEYLSNAALSMTSVSSTTILSSTSGLFTLLFGVSVGGERITTGKVLAALVSIAGVVMTELGKSSAADDQQVFGDTDRNPGEMAGQYGLPGHNLAGDICGLLSAVSYGFYTTLLRKYVGGEGDGEEKADLQKVFGYIGLFTLLGLWWLVFPLYLIGWEPVPVMPSTYGLDEDILANGLIGSMISDYFWAVSVVWTTPLVATLGLSLTIPLAMVADMVMHGRDYSLVYMLGAGGVFAGFLVANLGDECKVPSFFETGLGKKFLACCPCSWLQKKPSPSSLHSGIEDSEVVSDKEFD